MFYAYVRCNIKNGLAGKVAGAVESNKILYRPERMFFQNISDEEYEQLVQSKYAGLNLKQRALDKTGVDESQVNEIPPCEFKHWHYDKNTRVKRGKDGRLRTSAYQVTWLLFSDKLDLTPLGRER